MPLSLQLQVTNTATNTRVLRTFAHFPVRIGRNPLNDLHIAEGFISQFHAVLELHEGNILKLRDLGSRNGSRLGASRAPPNEPIDIGEANNSFSIGPLNFVAQLGNFQAEAVKSSEPPDSMPTGVLNSPAVMEKTLAFDEVQARKLAEARRRFASGGPQNLSQTAVLEEEPPDSFTIDLPNSPQLMEQMLKQRQLESMALAAVRELAQFYLPNRPRLETPEDVTRFVSRVRDTLDVFLRCFIPLRDGYLQFASEMDLRKQSQAPKAPAAIAVEQAQNERELGARLLDLGEDFGASHRAVEGTFADLMIHQLALLNAIMRGVKSLLTELSPQAIDHELAEAAKQGKTSGWTWGPWRFKELWRIYGAKHGDVDDGDKRTFAALFGRDFASAYGQYRGGSDPNDASS